MSSTPIPTHLTADLAEYLRGDLDGDFDRRMDLFSGLIVADAIPTAMRSDIDSAVANGDLSPAGDRLRYSSDEGFPPDGDWTTE
jgi:hypothetical protein